MLIQAFNPATPAASPARLPKAATADRFTPSSELPYPRITAFLVEGEGYRQVQRVQHDGASQLELPEGRLIVCKRHLFGGKLTAFDAEGRVRWENDPGSCANLEATTLCPESNTAYVFPYGAVQSIDLTTGEYLRYRSLGNWSRSVFGTADGKLLSVDNRRLHLYDRQLELMHETPYGFEHARVDYDRSSGLVTLQGPDWEPDKIRHAVYTDRGARVLDEPLRTVHPGLPDGAGRLWQVVCRPDGSGSEVLRLEGQQVTRFPVEQGVVIAFPLKDGSFATLGNKEAVLRNSSGAIVSRQPLPDEALVGLTATPSGPLLNFENRGVLLFDGGLRELCPAPALTAGLADGSFLVVDKSGVRHHREDGVETCPDLWQAAEQLGPLASYREGIPILFMRGSQGWESLLADAERLLGAEPPPDRAVSLRSDRLEIVHRGASDEQARQRLGLPAQDWGDWKAPVSETDLHKNRLARQFFHGTTPPGMDPETWDRAHVFSGYREQPTAVSQGTAGRYEVLGLGTVSGQVKLVNLGPQMPQTGDRLPGAVVRTELTPNGLVAVDERGNLMMIEPYKLREGIVAQKSFDEASVLGPSKTGLEVTETSVQVGGVRVRRRSVSPDAR